MKQPLGVALVHYPVRNRNGELITTAVTSLDVHDIARSALTFGVRHFFVVTPAEEQRRLVHRLLDHWREGFGSRYNPDRARALGTVHVVASLEQALEEFSSTCGRPARPLLTGAGRSDGIGVAEVDCLRGEVPLLLTLGTGSGLAETLFEQGWPVLEPIEGVDDYSHLSVRAAAAILLDRLSGSDR